MHGRNKISYYLLVISSVSGYAVTVSTPTSLRVPAMGVFKNFYSFTKLIYFCNNVRRRTEYTVWFDLSLSITLSAMADMMFRSLLSDTVKTPRTQDGGKIDSVVLHYITSQFPHAPE